MNTALPTGTLIERLQPVKALRIYLRQSLEESQQAESIPTQRAEIERLAYALGVTRAQWKSRHEYPDVDRAGDDFAGREKLQLLLREAAANDLVLAWKQDRVGRDMIDAAATIRELVKFRRCNLFTVETGTTPVTLDSAEQTAIVLLRGMVSQGELENTRKRVRAGLRQRAIDGFASGPIPFGYRTVLVDPNVKDPKQSKKRIEINESAAAVVRQIYQLYLDGHGFNAIAKRLNKEGALSPRGNGWSQSNVWDIVRAPRYKGEWSHGKRRVVRRQGDRVLRERAEESDVIRVEHPELAIIAPDEWQRVQAAIAERTRKMPSRFAPASHMLTRTLRCGECDGPMHIKVCDGRRTDWKKRYYVCTEQRRAGRCSNSKYLPADAVEGKLVEYLRSTVLGQLESKIRDSIREELRRVGDVSDVRKIEAEKIRTQLQDLKAERQRLVRMAAATDAPEVLDALCANQERAKALEPALAVAIQPPLDATIAARLEAAALAQVDRMRQQLDHGDARAAFTALFPAGLRFKIGNGLWLIQGAASVPTYRSTSEYRLPPR